MNIVKVLVITIGVFMFAVFAAPFVLGAFIVASVGHTPQGQAAIATSQLIADKQLQRKLMERAIERNFEDASRRHDSVESTTYRAPTEFPASKQPVPGEPMLDPKPLQ